MLGMGGGACATWKVVHDTHPISNAKRGKSHGKSIMPFPLRFFMCSNPEGHDLPVALHPKNEQRCDALPYLFGAQIHSESHGPMRRVLVDRGLGPIFVIHCQRVNLLVQRRRAHWDTDQGQIRREWWKNTSGTVKWVAEAPKMGHASTAYLAIRCFAGDSSRKAIRMRSKLLKDLIEKWKKMKIVGCPFSCSGEYARKHFYRN